MESSEQIPPDLLESEDRLRDAMLAGDANALEELLDDRLRFAGPDGQVIGKAHDVEAHRTGLVRFDVLDIVDRALVAETDVAVAIVTARAKGTAGSETFDSLVRYTRCWVRRSDGWRILGGSVTPVG